MALGGANLEALKEDGDKLKAEEEESEFGSTVQLVLSLPEGTEETLEFKLGQTVQYVKAFLNNRHGFPMNTDLVTSCDGQSLMDPLSLSDCRAITAGKLNLITVKVPQQ